MEQLENWLKQAEEEYRKMSIVAKSKERLEKQLHDVKVSTSVKSLYGLYYICIYRNYILKLKIILTT